MHFKSYEYTVDRTHDSVVALIMPALRGCFVWGSLRSLRLGGGRSVGMRSPVAFDAWHLRGREAVFCFQKCRGSCGKYAWMSARLLNSCSCRLEAVMSPHDAVPAVWAPARGSAVCAWMKMDQALVHRCFSSCTVSGGVRKVSHCVDNPSKAPSGTRFDAVGGAAAPVEGEFAIDSLLGEAKKTRGGAAVEATPSIVETGVVRLRSPSEPSFVLFASPSVPARLRHVESRRIAAQVLASSGDQGRGEVAASDKLRNEALEGNSPSSKRCSAGPIGLRVEVSGGGCSGYQYKYEVVSLDEAEGAHDV